MKVTYHGHSTFEIELRSCNIIIDPFITPNEKAKLDISSIKVDYVLLSHGHQDHIFDAEAVAKSNQATLISNFEIANHFGKLGVKSVIGMNHGGQTKLGESATLKMVNAVHSSSFPDGSYAGNPAGFIIKEGDHGLYFAGDTALHADMDLFGRYEQLSLAILPIGDLFTMGVKDALIAADLCKVDKVIGCHYDTFPPITIDHQKSKDVFKSAGKELILMQIGSSIEL